VSAKALHDRLLSITALPRPAVQLGEYCGPEPRKLVAEAGDASGLHGRRRDRELTGTFSLSTKML
jgi:hypothetical protein